MDMKTAEYLTSENASELIAEIHSKFSSYDEFAIINYLAKHKDLKDFQRPAILELLNQQQRAAKKIFNPQGLLFERSALEQATNFALAYFHRRIFEIFTDDTKQKLELLDGTAGLGFDTIAFSKSYNLAFKVYCDESLAMMIAPMVERLEESEIPGFFEINSKQKIFNVTSVEQNPVIYKLLEFNSQMLKLENRLKNIDVLEFLENNDNNFDVLFFDPSRRSQEQRFASDIEIYSPSVPKIIQQCTSKFADATIGIKTAPALAFRFDYITRKYPNFADFSAFSVSHKNNLKECFLLRSPALRGQKISAVANLNYNSSNQSHQHTQIEIFLQTKNAQSVTVQELQGREIERDLYIHEPASALRTFNLVPRDFVSADVELFAVSPALNLILSRQAIGSKIAQSYKILAVTKPEKKAILKELENLERFATHIREFHNRKFKFKLPKRSESAKLPAQLFFISTKENFVCAIVEPLKIEIY